MNVGYRSLVEQVAEALFALYQRLVRTAQPRILGPQAFQIRRGSGEQRFSWSQAREGRPALAARTGSPNGQRPFLTNQARERRNSSRPPHCLRPVSSGKSWQDLFGMIRGLAVQDCFARSTVERDLEVVHETSASPNRTRPKPRTSPKSSETNAYWHSSADARCLDERIEETIARFRFDSRDDLAQGRVVGRGLDRELLRTHRKNPPR